MTKSQLIKLICLMIIIAVTIFGSVLVLGLLGGGSLASDALVISSGSAEAVYNGEPLTSQNWKVASGKLQEGHSVVVETTGSQTDVGTSDNYIIATVRDKDGNDVSEQYNIKYEYGKLTVTARPVTVTAGSGMKMYDGTPLSSEKYTVTSSAPLLSGHTFDVTVDGSITEIGQTSNQVISVTIYDKSGKDVTRNYDVTTMSGTLLVYSADSIVISSGSKTDIYTGDPITNDRWDLINGELKEGHELVVSVFGSQTNVGSCDNSIRVDIFDEWGNNVTSEYNVILDPGELTVIPQPLDISSGDAEKVYDGSPLTNSDITIGPEGIEDLFDIQIEMTGERNEMGISDNSFEVTIFDKFGNDVTENFEINKDVGYLKVTDENGDPGDDDDRVENTDEGVGPSGEGGGPGGGGSGEGGTIPGGGGGNCGLDMSGQIGGGGSGGGGGGGEPVVYFTLSGSKKDYVYLRMKSFGDFDGQKQWLDASDYGILTDEGMAAYYITALALQNSGLTTSSLSITPNGGVFALPYYTLDGNIEIQTSEVMQTREQLDSYYVNYFNWDNYAGIVLPAKYKAYEQAYREYVYDNYLYIDWVSYEYMLGIISEQGFSKDSSDIISRVARYISTAAQYNLEYDSALDEEPNVPIAFLETYKEGICSHYAASATLLFRALGIPARYTIGFVGEVEANKETTVTDKNYHAWVEVYVDGIGWVNVEVTGSGGPSESNPIMLSVNPSYTGAKFDESIYSEANPLLPENKVDGLKSLILEGYSYEAVVSGSNHKLGITQTEITELKIYDPFGKLVYDKSTGLGDKVFVIKYNTGKLQLYYSELTFESDGYTKTYDGISYLVSDENCYLTKGELQENYSYQIYDGASVCNSGTFAASYKVKVFDNRGVDRTDYYKINYKNGKIVINAREITVTAGSDSKHYDGSALTYNYIDCNYSELADGDYIYSYTISGSQTNVGKSSNVVKEVVIFNGAGDDVTGNYIIKTVEGTLTVLMPY